MVAVAAAACCAVAVTGGLAFGDATVPVAAYVAVVACLVAFVAARPARRVVAPASAGKIVAGQIGAMAVAVLVVGPPTIADNLGAVGSFWAALVVAHILLWPEPTTMRYCLMLSAASVLGRDGGLSGAGPALLGLMVATAVALVAVNRLAAATSPRLDPADGEAAAAPVRRRVARDACIVLAVVVLVALAAAALIPPPTGRPAGGGSPGPVASEPSPLLPSEELDVTDAERDPGRDVVLNVAAPGPDVWRAATLDRWDGRVWRRSPEPPIDTAVRSTPAFLAGLGDPPVGERFRQRITIKAPAAAVLVAAPAPTLVELAEGGIRSGLDGSLLARPILGEGASYVVDSLRPQVGASALRSRDPEGDDLPPMLGQLYLQLPAVSDRVRAKAADITATAANAYDQTVALERWLAANTEVETKVPALADGESVVDAFVFDGAPGSPARSATAMVVMLRSVGVPARLAVGFLPGRRSLLGDGFVVRASDSHAWVEAWFPEGGWRRFDPSGRIVAAEQQDSWLARLGRLLRQLLWPLAVLGVAVVGWFAWRWTRRRRWRAAEAWVTRYLRRVDRAGSRRGRPRRPAETPAEYVGALAESVLPDPRLEEVATLVTAAAYGTHAPAPETQRWAEQVLAEAEAAAGRPRRRWTRRGG